MGFLDNLRKKEERKSAVDTYFKMIHAYSPVFSSYSGGVYEMELTRAAIHAFAKNISKASPVIKGEKYEGLQNILQTRPNDLMSTSQFLYKLATIYKAENNAFVIPLYEDRAGGRITGFYPVRGADVEIVKVGTKLMLKYKVYSKNNNTAETFAIPYEEVGHLRNHYYRNELYGENHNALLPTLELISTQRQGIIESVKSSANIRFMAKLMRTLKPEDLKAEQKRLKEINLSSDNNGGVFLYDASYDDVKQVVSSPYNVDPKQTEMIQNNIFNYFGTNEKVLQGSCSEQEWESYYESELEPFLIELSQVMTNMIFNQAEVKTGSHLFWEASRLQYMSSKTKMELWQNGFDRGLFNHNDGRSMFNMPTKDDGDKYYIRLEYAEVGKLPKKEEEDDNT
jgi:HK97 family phage portal protein